MVKNKKIVDIDEDTLKGMMIGDVPVFGRDKRENIRNESTSQESENSEQSCETEHRSEYKTQTPPQINEKNKDVSAYRRRFLVQVPASIRCQTYINRDIYERIKRFLPVIANDVSISSYVSNILNDHLEKHWSQISELYDEESSKPL